MSWYQQWKPYVPVAQRRAKAAAYATKLAKKEKRTLSPVKIEGRIIARSYWGQAWCDNLESYSDFANRLPRGRTYVRNGSVIDLQIQRGKIKALVSGSDVYHVTIAIKTLKPALWTRIKRDCSRSIHSLIDLLQGRFDQGVMQRLSQRDGGLFPPPKEIDMDCSCPDWAGMCKHVAAVLYGVGARLDTAPELLFTLRHVDHLELITTAASAENLDHSLAAGAASALATADLGAMFGIELDATSSPSKKPRRARLPAAATVVAIPAEPEAARKKSPAGKNSRRRDTVAANALPLAPAASIAKVPRKRASRSPK
jgi:uncharacterized Zn finger protein